MTPVPIRDLVVKTRQVDPIELGRSTFQYIDIASIDRETKIIALPQQLPTLNAPSRARKLIQNCDVLVSTVRPNLNAVAIVPQDYDGEIASTGFCVLRTKPQVDPYYLFYMTQTSEFVHHLTHVAEGASYPAVTDDDVLDFSIVCPEPSEQRRIAAILSAADGERRRRRYIQSAQSDRFAQDLFVEKFGDPATNPMGWELATLEKLKTKFKYGTSEKCVSAPSGLPVLRIPNILQGRIDLSDLKYAELPTREIQSLSLVNGDLVFVRTNGNPDYVGRAAVFDLQSPFLFASYLIRARLQSDRLVPIFLAEYLRTPYGRSLMSPYIRTTAGQSNISIEGLKSITVPLPRIDLQHAYVETLALLGSALTQQTELTQQTDHLFQSLLDRAFRGEL